MLIRLNYIIILIRAIRVCMGLSWAANGIKCKVLRVKAAWIRITRPYKHEKVLLALYACVRRSSRLML